MNSQPRVLNFDDVIDLCGSVATSRGQVCKATGAVKELDWIPDSDVLYAIVQGSESEPYHVRVTIAAHRFEGECTCPSRQNCKHVAAVLLSWIDRQTATPTPDDQALRAVNRWLQQLVDQGRRFDKRQEHHELGEPLLFYQLERTALNQSESGIRLQILQTRLLKRGGYGKETPYRFNGNYYHPEWVLPSDRAILELAVGKNNELAYRDITISGDIGHLLMSKLISTGRCYWGDSRTQALNRGSAQSLEINWSLGQDQSYRLETLLPGSDQWELIATDPPWYIDPLKSVAAPLENTPPAQVLSLFLDAPALPAAHAQAVSNYLASRLPDSRLPLPYEPDFVRIDEPPQPVLVLQSREDSADIRDFFASIKFRYADYLLPFDGMDADPTLEGKTPEGRPLVLKRDLAAEVRHAVDFGKLFTEFEPARKADRHASPGIAIQSGAAHSAHIASQDNRGQDRALHQQPQQSLHNGAYKNSANHLPNAADADFFSKADRLPRSREVHRVAAAWRGLLAQRDELVSRGWTVQIREPFDLNFHQVTAVEATISETTSNWFDMALKLEHGKQKFDLLPLVIDWLQGDSRDSSILIQADDGQWLEVAPDLFAPIVETLMELYDDPRQHDRLLIPRQRATTIENLESEWENQGVSVAWHNAGKVFELADRLRNFSGLEPVSQPAGVNAQLRPYQLDGLAWMGFLAEYGFNGILADDMGLGKTLQTLAHIQQERDLGRLDQPTLIVAPTSLLGNWEREAARFTPSLKTFIWHGTQRKLGELRSADLDMVITSYALVTRDILLLSELSFGLVVLDEAQAIKNPAAKVSQAVKTLKVERRLCLTGTPLENHLGELWSQFDFLMPGFLGTRKHFNRQFRSPIETHADLERQQRLQTLIKPFLLRRRKEQVATELPPKTVIVREVTLEPEQARLYESIRVSMEHRVRHLLAEKGLSRSHIEMLDALLKLRQTCCHPALVKLDSARGIKASAKTELLMSMLDELIDEGKKILLFSQFTEMLGLIEKELRKSEIPYVKLTGKTRKRDEVIDAFQHGEVPLFLISLKAGGTGLNLTAADTVIHYDPWWNPAAEDQASDRAHRIGQDKPVFIYKLVASNTVEEKIMEMQEHKKLLANQTVNQGENKALQALTADDVMSLFSAVDQASSAA